MGQHAIYQKPFQACLQKSCDLLRSNPGSLSQWAAAYIIYQLLPRNDERKLDSVLPPQPGAYWLPCKSCSRTELQLIMRDRDRTLGPVLAQERTEAGTFASLMFWCQGVWSMLPISQIWLPFFFLFAFPFRWNEQTEWSPWILRFLVYAGQWLG